MYLKLEERKLKYAYSVEKYEPLISKFNPKGGTTQFCDGTSLDLNELKPWRGNSKKGIIKRQLLDMVVRSVNHGIHTIIVIGNIVIDQHSILKKVMKITTTCPGDPKLPQVYFPEEAGRIQLKN